MKGKSKIKQTTVLLMAFVLVVGLVGLGGHVYGDSDSDYSDITVNAAEVQIEINALEQTDQDIDLLEGDAVNTADHNDNGDPEDIYIEVSVTLDDEATQDDIEEIYANFSYDGGETEHGDAITGAENDDQYNLTGSPTDGETNGGKYDDWTLVEDFSETEYSEDDEAIYEAYLEIDNMMRYGDWDVEAYVLDTGGNDDTDNQEFDVSTFVEIETEGEIEGTAAPGQTLVMEATESGEREWTEKDSITTFRINSMYNLDSEMTDLVGDDNGVTIDSEHYNNDGYLLGGDEVGEGTPIDSTLDKYNDNVIEPQNQVEIPTGIEPDTYKGEVYHTLLNSEVNPSIEFVSTEGELEDALDNGDVETIVVTDDITTDNAFYVEHEQTIKAINEHAVTITFDEDNTNALFYVQAEGVTIEDLKLVRNAEDLEEGQVAQAIRVEESDTTIHNNEFSGNAPIGVTVQDEDDDGGEETDTTDVRITDNTFDGFNTSVALMPALGSPSGGDGYISDVTITGNEFNGYEGTGVYVDEFDHGSEIENVILTSNTFDSEEQGDDQWHVAEAYYNDNGEADILDWDEDGTGIIDDNTFEQDVEFEDITDDDDPDYYIIRSTEVN